jgi:ribosome recycling factor
MLEKAKDWITKAIAHLDFEFSKLQLWRANPNLVEDIIVEQYWVPTPLKNMAWVSCLDAQTLSIKPYDKTILWEIAKAISNSWLWLNPQVMADSIMIKIPALTEERRIELTKVAKKIAEEAKIWVRNARWDSLKTIKNAEDNKEISEDEKKDYEKDLQKLVDEANKKIDEHLKKKNEDIMKV